MDYIYIVIDRKAGFIFGAYADRAHAEQVFNVLVKEGMGEELCISQEPVIYKAAHHPCK